MPPLPAWLEQASQDVPASEEWLSPSELSVLARSPVPKRREEWRLGRWTAKRALLLCAGRLCKSLKLAALNGDRRMWCRLEVKAAADGVPEAFLDGARLPVRLSLTHRAGLAACAIVPDTIDAGCDMELVEAREAAFIDDYFTPAERAMVVTARPEERPLTTTLIWSAKESALKALRVGLRADTREVEVHLLPWLTRAGWRAFAVHRRERPRLLSGWWRVQPPNVITFVSSPATDPPVRLL